MNNELNEQNFKNESKTRVKNEGANGEMLLRSLQQFTLVNRVHHLFYLADRFWIDNVRNSVNSFQSF